MKRKSNQDIFSSVQNGETEILFYLCDRYFSHARKWLRRNGMPDESTPEFFVDLMLDLLEEIRMQNMSSNVEFESLFYNTLKNSFENRKGKGVESPEYSDDIFNKIAATCISNSDENTRDLLNSRYALNLSFEQIASRFDFSNPVIAQFEVNKAMNRLLDRIKTESNHKSE
ncbi:MAG: hypothetical protein DWQ44_12385 [Bacteroidetes bacterium]|nr:MAG: hypothetical protein DWQ33_07625 [Bacteroidota bacterium]REK08074.1 MAG: hypothetical protein DWQ39_00530 [Bacteroidota bacterium]REK32279.1 MAG: hypothetical protein DWQ44_12385 [Bacteroidota bacterium]REK47431.1 MAG: hypothetical protein DWQ48_12955 [Bacteroidota bacterium]